MRPAIAISLMSSLFILSACDDEKDNRVTREDVKEAVSPRTDAGLKGSKSMSDQLGIQTIDAKEVAQHPGLYPNQTLRSPLRLVEYKDGIARFAADDSDRFMLSLRVTGELTPHLQQLASTATTGPAKRYMTVTYRIDGNLAADQSPVGEIKDLDPASDPVRGDPQK